MHSEPIAVNIPIGYSDFRTIVSLVTITISWVACYFIVVAIQQKSNLLKKRI